ncbi:hypothetical protein [Mucilaginibacter terrae]|uniref:Uncharacterized protein n=1 Tax=Mucilaginibacter terrae TaxID=1955052 RepID=A0ABU3GUN9_9SPHI|nr:hypothetical protein [Mucilaginibacter terrae]MDT3403488.1 hypothetical protein [Mucilaginibacter terrae]
MLTLFLVLPFLVFAQTEPVVLEELYKNCRGLYSFKLNDDVSIVQVNTDNENFDMLAINEQMKVLWKVTLPGYALSSGKFKDKIVAVGSTEKEKSEYKGFVLDPLTGKIILEKTIYNGGDKKTENAYPYFTEKGDCFKMTFAKVKITYPAISMSRKPKTTILSLVALDFDISLNVNKLIETKLPDGKIYSYGFNTYGDLMVVHSNNEETVDVSKYSIDKNTPVATQKVSFNAHKKFKANDIDGNFSAIFSANRDMVYLALMHPNEEKETQLSLLKLNMADGKTQTITEVFNKDHIKDLKRLSFLLIPK